MSVIGFLGTGRIAGAVVSGLCDSSSPPDRILLSPRNADVARSLAQRYPTVRVTKDNGEVVTSSDIVVVGLPPEKAEAALGELRFRAEQRVVSVMAMIPGERIVKMVSPAGVVRVLPLPSISQAMGPIVIHPSVRWATELFSPLGEVLTVEDEAQLDTIWSGTSVIAAKMSRSPCWPGSWRTTGFRRLWLTRTQGACLLRSTPMRLPAPQAFHPCSRKRRHLEG